MAGIGQQRQRMRQQSIDHFRNHKAGVERHADRERHAEVLRRMHVAVAVRVGVAVIIVIMLAVPVRILCRHCRLVIVTVVVVW